MLTGVAAAAQAFLSILPLRARRLRHGQDVVRRCVPDGNAVRRPSDPGPTLFNVNFQVLERKKAHQVVVFQADGLPRPGVVVGVGRPAIVVVSARR